MLSLKRKLRWAGSLAGLCLIASIVVVYYWIGPTSYKPLPKSFDGSSEALRETVVVPTLDSQIPPHKSAIWCSSFQIAWNRFKADLAGEPILLKNAESIAERLNQAEASEEDLEPDSFYAAAGTANDGIVGKIRKEMAQKFPRLPVAEFSIPANGAMAYAYLTAGVKYKYPYFENSKEFLFQDSLGQSSPVGSFGIAEMEHGKQDKLREQIEVLFYASKEWFRAGLNEAANRWLQDKDHEFAVDLCKHSKPNQIVLASIPRKDTLGKAVADVQTKIEDCPPDPPFHDFRHLETLLVANMHWRVEHHFKDLEGEDKLLLNPSLLGLYLETALQIIEFKMDRSGAELTSEAKLIPASPPPKDCSFKRPFLIYLKKRDAKNPFFVMWVDNAELLQKRSRSRSAENGRK